MSTNGESSPDASSLPSQAAPLLHALTQWQKPDNDLTPLTTLRLYRQAWVMHNGDEALAINAILQQGLTRLAHTDPIHADVLQSRLLAQEKGDVAARR